MASIILTVPDESMLSSIKKACLLLKGVSDVKVQKAKKRHKDITSTEGYKEAMDDIRAGRVFHAKNTEDLFDQILGNV